MSHRILFTFAFAICLGSTLQATEVDGKVICGYQGWFRTPDDASGHGWHHYGSGPDFAPGHATIDLWPDINELPKRARVDTGFRNADGSVAQVFSSSSPAVAKMHFGWMQEYGIDGVFIQRFAVIARNPKSRKPMDQVLENSYKEARRTDRSWGIMYDLSGLRPGNADVIIRDWNRLKAEHSVADTAVFPNYLEHNGKPLVALWGFGFSDRKPMWGDWRKLVEFFKETEKCAVMLGVPTYWREMKRDALNDSALHELLKKVDIVSPWTVGRYNSPEGAARHISTEVSTDIDWCDDRKIAYMPVSFPGFSWQNLMKTRGKDAALGAISRRGGRFLWSQLKGYQQAGASMLYVAMFDELDEGTAIMKWSNDPPVGETRFLTEPGIANDHYLWLTGMGGRLLNGGNVLERDGLPIRKND